MQALGVDVGGTNARAARVEVESGRVLASARASLTDKSPHGVARQVAELVAQVRTEDTRGAPVGIGFAGMLRDGMVVNAPNLGWRDVDFAPMVASLVGAKVRLINDLSAAAWGEFCAGAAKQATDSLTVFVGTGVGSAIIVAGQLVSGATGVAAEFGHVKLVTTGGRPCGCGQRGCLEAYAGGANLTAWMVEQGLSGTPSDLERLAASGEVKAVELYDFVASQLSLAVANQVTVLNPGVLVLGGGVLSKCPGLVARIRAAVAEHASRASAAAVRIELSRLGDDAGLVGAALLSGR